MKFSKLWLNEWFTAKLHATKIEEQLTMSGLEVDSTTPVANKINNVKVGSVVECKPHPNANKLQVTKVDVGEADLLDIVCGAKNCRQGLKVAVATIGAQLTEDFVIKPTEIRGEKSNGMLCAYSELGIDIDEQGIIELPEDAPIGQDINEYLKLDDLCIDIDLTPNRGDCLSIKGIARELAAIDETLTVTEPTITDITAQTENIKPATITAPESCSKFISRVINDVNINAPTPLWIKLKLSRSGIRSIDPVTDITNYVLLEIGQPMHGFDLDKINGDLQIRNATADEKITTLTEQEITLDSETLVVADANGALSIAGIIGGAQSAITESTKNILLESATFNADIIKTKAKKYNISTDSSYRFERGVDSEITELAIQRASQLITEICGGTAGTINKTSTNANQSKQPISLTQANANRILGIEVPVATIDNILTRLKFAYEKPAEDKWLVQAPSFRFDINIEADLIEEIARIYGYNNITELQPHADLTTSLQSETIISEDTIKQNLINKGYNEIISYSFVDPKLQETLHPQAECIKLPNPISQDMSVMRLSILSGLIKTIKYNQNRKQSQIKLFESGLVFIPEAEAEFGINQKNMLGIAISGVYKNASWRYPAKPVDFFDLKADLESILDLSAASIDFSFVKANIDCLHPEQTAYITYQNQNIGVIGTLHPSIVKKNKLEPTILCELALDKIINYQIPKFATIAKFPEIKRDLSILVNKDVMAADIFQAVKELNNDQIIDAKIFDLYMGENIQANQKSFAITFAIQNKEKTLEESEIVAITNSIITQLKDKCSATIRE